MLLGDAATDKEAPGHHGAIERTRLDKPIEWLQGCVWCVPRIDQSLRRLSNLSGLGRGVSKRGNGFIEAANAEQRQSSNYMSLCVTLRAIQYTITTLNGTFVILQDEQNPSPFQ